jgi:cytochrome oxidase assembly protein ShyY1
MNTETLLSLAFLLLQIVFLLGTWQIAKSLLRIIEVLSAILKILKDSKLNQSD